MIHLKKTILILLCLCLTLCSAACGETQNDTADTTTAVDTTTSDGYKLVFSEEFDGDSLNTDIWGYEIGFIRNNEPQYYTDRPENVSVRDGNLVITCQQENYTAEDGTTASFTSGSVNTQKGYSFTYGKIEMRAKLPVSDCQACWPAFWLLGVNEGWPYGGEIDIVEMYGTNYNRYESNIHWSDPSLSDEYGGHVHFYNPAINYKIEKVLDEPLGNDWHTYGMIWDEQKMEFLFDGESIGSFDITGAEMTELHTPQYILLNLALTQEGDTTPLYNGEKLEYLIDYVRVYQK